MTKNILKITLSLIMAVWAIACTDSDAGIRFSLGTHDEEPIEMTAVGGKDIILVETNESWVATTNVPWITISPANGLGTMSVEVLIDSSLTNGRPIYQ